MVVSNVVKAAPRIVFELVGSDAVSILVPDCFLCLVEESSARKSPN